MSDRFEEAVRQAGRELSASHETPLYHDAWARGRRRRFVKRGAVAFAGAALAVAAVGISVGDFGGPTSFETDDVALGPAVEAEAPDDAAVSTATSTPEVAEVATAPNDTVEPNDTDQPSEPSAVPETAAGTQATEAAPPSSTPEPAATAAPAATAVPVASTPVPAPPVPTATSAPAPASAPTAAPTSVPTTAPAAPPVQSADAGPTPAPTEVFVYEVAPTPGAENNSQGSTSTADDATDTPATGAVDDSNEDPSAIEQGEPAEQQPGTVVEVPDPALVAVAPPPAGSEPGVDPTAPADATLDIANAPPDDARLAGECDSSGDGVADALCEILEPYPCDAAVQANPGYTAVDTTADGAIDTCAALDNTSCDTNGDLLADVPCIISELPADG